jgi:hypothetical protein
MKIETIREYFILALTGFSMLLGLNVGVALTQTPVLEPLSRSAYDIRTKTGLTIDD